MENTIVIRKISISAQKNRLVANLIRGQKVNVAIEILNLTNKKSSLILKKGIYSAISNLKKICDIKLNELIVKYIFVDKSRSMKRFSARAKGRGNRIEKQTCNIVIKIGN